MSLERSIGFTPKFQAGALALLLTDMDFASSVIESLEPSYFDAGEIYIKFLRFVKTLYVKYQSVGLTADMFRNVISRLQASGSLTDGDANGLLTILDLGVQLTPGDKDFIKTNVFEFIKKQTIACAFSDAIESFEKQDYDKVYSVMTGAFNKTYGLENSLGESYLDMSVHDRYSVPPRQGIWPTRFERLNKYIGGGIAQKECASIVSSTGRGKTALLCNLAVDAMYAGKRVAFITLEMAQRVIEQRVDAIISGWSPAELASYPEARVELEQLLLRRPPGGYLQVKEFPRGTLTPGQLTTYLDRLILSLGKIDVVIVDWLGCMKLPKTGSGEAKRYEVMAEIADELVNMSRRYEVSMLTAHQTNRSGTSQDVFSYGAVSESFSSLFGLDLVLGLGASDKAVDSGKRTLTILKSRLGPDSVFTKLAGNRPDEPINYRFTEMADDEAESEAVSGSVHED